MKILVLAPHPFYLERGTPIALDYLLRSFSDQGHEVRVCCYHEGTTRTYPGSTIYRIAPPRFLRRIGAGFSAKKLLADVYLLRLALTCHRDFRPDVVHAGEEAVFFARLIKAMYGTPYVYDMDSSIAQQMVEKFGFLRPLSGLFVLLERYAIRHSVACAPVCPALGELAKAHGASHVTPLYDISQLTDPNRSPTGFLRRKLSIPKDRSILMYVGNLERYQGVDLLLEGFAQGLQLGANAELVIAGGNAVHMDSYLRMASSLGIQERTHFLGHFPLDRLDELLAEADILTAPRITGLNTPQKIYPYLHTGKPVLLTDLPTHTQIVDDSVCRLADPTPAAFGQAIAELSADGESSRLLGEAGQAFVERNHTYEAHCRRLAQLYEHVAGVVATRTQSTGDTGATR